MPIAAADHFVFSKVKSRNSQLKKIICMCMILPYLLASFIKKTPCEGLCSGLKEQGNNTLEARESLQNFCLQPPQTFTGSLGGSELGVRR